MTPSNTPHRLAREATAAELAAETAKDLPAPTDDEAAKALAEYDLALQSDPRSTERGLMNPKVVAAIRMDAMREALRLDRLASLALPQLEEQQRWRPISSAPKVKRILAVVDGAVRVVAWTKTSHVPIYGWCLVDQGIEECDLCEPTLWQEMPLPPTQDTTTQETTC